MLQGPVASEDILERNKLSEMDFNNIFSAYTFFIVNNRVYRICQRHILYGMVKYTSERFVLK